MSSASNNIPFVPENTIDPAAGLNESIKVIDALIQLSVVGVNVNAPPASPVAGDRYIIGTAPTGAWTGQSGKMAQWLDGGWNFYTAYFCVSGGIIYSRSGGVWAPVSGSGEANTASNIGSGYGVFASKSGVNLQFKSLAGGANVSITEAGDTLTISASGSGGGDVSTVAGVSPVSGDVPAADLKAALDVPGSPSDIGAATAAQGALADTAVQPSDLAGYERALTAGANINIDRTDPDNPVISASGAVAAGGVIGER
ncbi:DUF2793 domain-containing protein [Pseudomonas sp. MDMC_285]|nr:DUF2793 domain-containing protein [Pseudomonas sp. MDMC_285]